MVTDFLGIIPVTSCTGADLANAVKDYLKLVGLPLNQLNAIGTDGAPNMRGAFNSLYTHHKKDVPNLLLLKCVCHSIDKCAEKAFKNIPDNLTFLLSETYNYFAHSAKRLGEYADYFKTINSGKIPGKLQPLSQTRWLVWLPVSEQILDQWHELRGFFTMKEESGDFKAKLLANEYKNNCNLLYLTFLRAILRAIHTVNLAFELTNADVTKLYSDLRSLLYSLAGRILKPQAIAETCRPGMLKAQEIEMLKKALTTNADNLLPIDRVNYGEKFQKLLPLLNVPEEDLKTVRHKCGEYIYTLCQQLIGRLPSNVDVIEKLKFFSARLVLTNIGRPSLRQLPVELADPSVDCDVLETQWIQLGTLTLPDICPHPDVNSDTNKIDPVHFWSCVLNTTDAAGNHPFEMLALFALKVLTMPINNAVVERIFSVLSCIKTKQRNRMLLLMLEALIRLRVHLKVNNRCCTTFEPSRDMLNRFSAQMYGTHHEADSNDQSSEGDLDQEDLEILALFDADGSSCIISCT